MNCRLTLYFAVLLHVLSGRNAIGDDYTPTVLCFSCQQSQPVSIIQEMISRADGLKRKICRDCSRTPGCFECRLPSVKHHTIAEDDRFFCNEHFANAVFDRTEAARIAYEVTRELTPLFYRFDMKFPANNVTVSIVDGRTLCALAGIYYDPRNCGLRGLNRTTYSQRQGFRHEIYLLSGLPRKRLCAVYAHEVGHAWMEENLPAERTSRLDRDTKEGFCELIAYQLMDSRSEEYEKGVIKENLYTSGQQNMLVETDSWYGFQKIHTWFREGKVSYLDEPDTIRTTVAEKRATEPKSLRPRVIHESLSSAPALPASVIVKGISGTPGRRIALINNVTLHGRRSRHRALG